MAKFGLIWTKYGRGCPAGTVWRLGSGTPSKVRSLVLVCWSTAISKSSFTKKYPRTWFHSLHNFLKMTTISVEIPKLSVGQSVESWRNLYVAATGSLKLSQQLALLPNYIDRTSGDHEIAKLAALDSTLDKALNVIETLIDV